MILYHNLNFSLDSVFHLEQINYNKITNQSASQKNERKKDINNKLFKELFC